MTSASPARKRKAQEIDLTPDAEPSFTATDIAGAACAVAHYAQAQAACSFNWSRLLAALRRDAPRFATKEALVEFVKFMIVKTVQRDFDATRLSPSPEIDAVWHQFLQFPGDYSRFCLLLTGQPGVIIDHNPLASSDADDVKTERYSRTLQGYTAVFGAPPTGQMWPVAGRAGAGPVAPAGAKLMDVFAVELTGGLLKVQCWDKMTVAELKVQIRQQNGVPLDQQRLLFCGKELKDEHTLSDYCITHKSRIHLVLRLVGC